MWLSLIWANENVLVVGRGAWPNALEVGTPPPIVQRSPVPAQAMHLRKPRRSTPSLPSLVSLEAVVIRFLPESRPEARRTSGPESPGLAGELSGSTATPSLPAPAYEYTRPFLPDS